MLLIMSHVTILPVLLVPAFYTPNLDLWEKFVEIFTPVSNFSPHLYQIYPRLWEIPVSGCKCKTFEKPSTSSHIHTGGLRRVWYHFWGGFFLNVHYPHMGPIYATMRASS